jgi:hypothetical protein
VWVVRRGNGCKIETTVKDISFVVNGIVWNQTLDIQHVLG